MGNKHLTRHHIVPTSRGGTSERCNLAYVPRRDHEHYHTLFGNRTPDEIVRYLQYTFWNGFLPRGLERQF